MAGMHRNQCLDLVVGAKATPCVHRFMPENVYRHEGRIETKSPLACCGRGWIFHYSATRLQFLSPKLHLIL